MVDFLSAAQRHFRDAEHLLASGYSANAGQLFGFQAECGLKALLIAQGLRTDSAGDIDGNQRNYRVHIDGLSQLILTLNVFPNGRIATRYTTMIPNVRNFSDWRVNHRYWNEDTLPLTSVSNWRLASNEIEAMLDQARMDGVIS
jgi:hypothetical protein